MVDRRNLSSTLFLMAALVLAVLISKAAADEVEFALVPSVAKLRMGSFTPQRLRLTTKKPEAARRLPADLSAPLFGALELGPKESPTTIVVVVDEPSGAPARLFVDANGNSDLRDDPPTVWTSRPYKSPDGQDRTDYVGGANVKIDYGKHSAILHLAMYRFDKNDPDPSRAELKDILFYYSDYAREGEITLGNKKYRALLTDNLTTGDFRGRGNARVSGAELFIDKNGDGKFDRSYEAFDVRKPFNIGGTTYEIAGLTAAGDRFTIRKSTKTVAELQAAPRAGEQALAFKARTTAGQEVDFPAGYKGKLVLLEFWATWCGPCLTEVPSLAAAYQKLHPRGLEVIGISLDQARAAGKLADFTRDKNMPWPEIYDGKFWEADIAKLYNVRAIPQAFLVDGETGEILAAGVTLRGNELEKIVEQFLAKKVVQSPGSTP